MTNEIIPDLQFYRQVVPSNPIAFIDEKVTLLIAQAEAERGERERIRERYEEEMAASNRREKHIMQVLNSYSTVQKTLKANL